MTDEEKKPDEKKIIVDEDWKAEARKEKEILAAEEKTEKKEQQQSHGPLPKGDFAALISMLTTQIFFSLGLIHLEGREPKEPDLELAKYNIDMLDTLEQKCKGNLTEQEEKVLKSTLNEVRMAYVKLSG